MRVSHTGTDSNKVKEVLQPASETMAVLADPTRGRLLPAFVDGVVRSLLTHILRMKAKVSYFGARQLQADVQFVRRWVSNAPALRDESAITGFSLTSLPRERNQWVMVPALEEADVALRILMERSTRHAAAVASSVQLPDAFAWLAKRSRKRRIFSCGHS